MQTHGCPTASSRSLSRDAQGESSGLPSSSERVINAVRSGPTLTTSLPSSPPKALSPNSHTGSGSQGLNPGTQFTLQHRDLNTRNHWHRPGGAVAGEVAGSPEPPLELPGSLQPHAGREVCGPAPTLHRDCLPDPRGPCIAHQASLPLLGDRPQGHPAWPPPAHRVQPDSGMTVTPPHGGPSASRRRVLEEALAGPLSSRMLYPHDSP